MGNPILPFSFKYGAKPENQGFSKIRCHDEAIFLDNFFPKSCLFHFSKIKDDKVHCYLLTCIKKKKTCSCKQVAKSRLLLKKDFLIGLGDLMLKPCFNIYSTLTSNSRLIFLYELLYHLDIKKWFACFCRWFKLWKTCSISWVLEFNTQNSFYMYM